MAGNKYVYLNNGRMTTKSATQTSAGGANANEVVALSSTGYLDNSVMPPGIGADTLSVIASESLSAGAFVALWNNAGALNVRNADCTATGKEARGFVLAAVTSGQSATVYREGHNTSLSGLTVGSDYWLSTVGGTTTTPPSASGNVTQYLGIADSATSIDFSGNSLGVVNG